MNRIITTIAAGALAAACAIAPAAAQSLPPPGNVNPGSMNSGAEETGAENQPRSYGPAYYYGAPRAYYGPGYDAYAAQPRNELRPVRLCAGLWTVWPWHRRCRGGRRQQLIAALKLLAESPGIRRGFSLSRVRNPLRKCRRCARPGMTATFSALPQIFASRRIPKYPARLRSPAARPESRAPFGHPQAGACRSTAETGRRDKAAEALRTQRPDFQRDG